MADKYMNMPLRDGKFALVVRPASYGSVLGNHLPPALVSGVALIAGRVLPIEMIPFRVCRFFTMTSYPCPTCGLTRGFIAMARGNWLEVLHKCPLAVVLYISAAAVFAWNLVPLVLGVNVIRGPWLRLSGKGFMAVILILLGMVLANWFYRLGLGLD